MKVQFYTLAVCHVPDQVGGQAFGEILKEILEKNLREVAEFKKAKVGFCWADEQQEQEAG